MKFTVVISICLAAVVEQSTAGKTASVEAIKGVVKTEVAATSKPSQLNDPCPIGDFRCYCPDGTPSNGKGCLGGNLPPPGLPQDPCPIGDYRCVCPDGRPSNGQGCYGGFPGFPQPQPEQPLVSWKQEPGKLNQVQVDYYSQTVPTACGVNSNNDIFCTRSDYVQWYNLPGKLKQIAIAEGILFGINANNDIFFSHSALKNQVFWVRLPGKLTQISFDGRTVCGVGLNNDVYCADENIYSSPNWFSLPGWFKQVDVRYQEIYAVNGNDEIWYSPTVHDPEWIRLPGSLKQIQFNGQTLCGTNSADNIYCAENYLDSHPDWKQLPGKLSVVSIGSDNLLFGVNSNNDVYSGVYRSSANTGRIVKD